MGAAGAAGTGATAAPGAGGASGAGGGPAFSSSIGAGGASGAGGGPAFSSSIGAGGCCSVGGGEGPHPASAMITTARITNTHLALSIFPASVWLPLDSIALRVNAQGKPAISLAGKPCSPIPRPLTPCPSRSAQHRATCATVLGPIREIQPFPAFFAPRGRRSDHRSAALSASCAVVSVATGAALGDGPGCPAMPGESCALDPENRPKSYIPDSSTA